MISSDSHFFTNEEGATVLERFKKTILRDLTLNFNNNPSYVSNKHFKSENSDLTKGFNSKSERIALDKEIKERIKEIVL